MAKETELDLDATRDRVSRVISSCKNWEQMQAAKRYRENYEKTAERLTTRYMKKDARFIIMASIAAAVILVTMYFCLFAPR